MIVFVVGKHIAEFNGARAWEIQGVFDAEQKALDVCEGHTEYFVGPMNINEELPYETTPEWVGAYYPSEKGKAT